MKVVLTALSAMYIHKSLAPWRLKAYCDAYVPGVSVEVQEHAVNNGAGGIVGSIYQSRPDVAGFSCYIWNVEAVAKIAVMLKKYLPKCVIVLGGPEVSYETDGGAFPFADYVVRGAGEAAFAGILNELIAGGAAGKNGAEANIGAAAENGGKAIKERVRASGGAVINDCEATKERACDSDGAEAMRGGAEANADGAATVFDAVKTVRGPCPTGRPVIRSECGFAFADLPSPYTPEFFGSFRRPSEKGGAPDISGRLIYYESTRGCPFSCTYCLSGAASGVEELPAARVFRDMDGLLEHGAKLIKFTDRTFNADKRRAEEILRHISALDTDCVFHFEAAGDLFDERTLEIVKALPPGRVQFEIGVQSVNRGTLAAVGRAADAGPVLKNIRTIAGFGNCRVHADLIAGLPRETLDSFAAAIDECVGARPHVLQLGFLKLLKGTRIRENSADYGYVYNDFPPYEVFASNTMSFDEIIRLREIEAVIGKFYNSGVFANSVNFAVDGVFGGAYGFFGALADFCRGKDPKTTLKHAYGILLDFLRRYAGNAAAEHYVKLDCLSFDSKGSLPDEIQQRRDKKAENEYRRNSQPKSPDIRAEYFEYDGKTRLFIYGGKDKVRKSYGVVEMGEVLTDYY